MIQKNRKIHIFKLNYKIEFFNQKWYNECKVRVSVRDIFECVDNETLISKSKIINE